MPIRFNSILADAGIRPDQVILLRHQDHKADRGRSPFELWRDNRPEYVRYQALQSFQNRSKFQRAPLWATFVVTPAAETLFAGLYGATYSGELAEDRVSTTHAEVIDKAGSYDDYSLSYDERLDEFVGKLVVEWGDGTRAWVQRAENQNKQVVELRPAFQEPPFPGFLNLVTQLSMIESMPREWVAVLSAASGIYLLTCPTTKEQYVGSASGAGGFMQRWREYARTGHGGNVALKSRDPSDYQVSILESVGSGATVEEILAMETLWKRKLQSREMGLNRN